MEKRKNRVVFLASCIFVLVVVMIFPVVKLLRFRMPPKAGREQVFVYLDLDRGASIEKADSIAKRAVGVLREESGVKSIQSFTGIPPVLDFNGLFRGVSDRKGTHQITLKLNLIP